MSKTETNSQTNKTETKNIGPEADLTATLREATEKQVAQTREAYEQVKTTAEDMTNMLEDSFNTATRGTVDFNRRVIDVVRGNFDASFVFAQDMFGAKNAQEVLDIQSSYLQKQFETTSKQSKDLAEFAGDVARKTVQPFQENAARVFKDLNAAN